MIRFMVMGKTYSETIEFDFNFNRRATPFSRVILSFKSSCSTHTNLKCGSDIAAILSLLSCIMCENLFSMPFKTALTRGWQWIMVLSLENFFIVFFKRLIVGRTQPIFIFSSFCSTSNAWVKGSIILTNSAKKFSFSIGQRDNFEMFEYITQFTVFCRY